MGAVSGEWEANRRPAPWRRVAAPAALVLAGLLIGVVAFPRAPEPTLPIEAPTAEPTVSPAPAQDVSPPVTGRWAPMSPGPLSSRTLATSAWTGDELLVWGGRVSTRGRWFSDGAAYDPITDRWRMLAQSPLRARAAAAGVWTGRELIVWGGAGAAGDRTGPRGFVGPAVETAQTTQAYADGAAYNPRTDRWRRLPPSPLSPRRNAVMVWTGSEVVVWGGTAVGRTDHEPDGARYDPATDRWTPVTGGPLARLDNELVQAVSLDGRMLVWAANYTAAAAAAYDPARDAWAPLPGPPVQPGTPPAMATVAGGVMAWGAASSPPAGARPLAARYTTATNRWITVSAPPYAPSGAQQLAAADAMALAWQAGGGVAYDGVRDVWGHLPQGPDLRPDALSVWTGDRLLVWSPTGAGGDRGAALTLDNPWQPLPAPPTTIDAGGTTVWSGWLQGDQQVLVWGGLNHGSHDVGAAYDPAARLWEALPRSPLSRRVDPAGAWLDGEMIVVGGRDLPDAPPLHDAAAYSPAARAWRQLPDAPAAVAGDGVVVGGNRLYAAGLQSGRVAVATYTAARDAWQLLPPPPIHSSVDHLHTAWTDFELWVWGTQAGGPGAGAAYSPRRGTWRRLPPLRGVTGRLAWSWGTPRVFVVANDGTTASLGRGAVQWRRYARSPVRSPAAVIVWNGDAVLAVDPATATAAALDPRASAWAAFPAPPLPRHDDARLLWTGRDMYAFGGQAAAELTR